MKTAAEARAAMGKNNPEKLSGFKRVKDIIESAIKSNKGEVYLTGYIDDNIVEYLRNKGYKVESTSDRNESITIISW